MHTLDVDPRNVRFPHRCLACGAAPATSYTLEAKGGFDILLFAMRTRVDIDVPLCAACGRRKTWDRAGWFALIFAAFCGACGLVKALEAITGEPLVARVGMVLLVPAGLALLWWTRNREDRLYHRLRSPVWVAAFDEGACVARLGFREARARHEAGVLSGVLDPGEAAEPGGYREHAAPAPVPFTPPKRPFPWWFFSLGGLVAMGGAVAEYVDLAEMERTGRGRDVHVLVGLLYDLGGKGLVLALLLAVGLAGVALGFLIRRGMEIPPQVTEIPPQGAESHPQVAEIPPQGTESDPQVAEIPPYGAESDPRGTEIHRSGTRIPPLGTESDRRGTAIGMQGTESDLQVAEIPPRGVENDPGEAEMGPRETEMGPRRMESDRGPHALGPNDPVVALS